MHHSLSLPAFPVFIIIMLASLFTAVILKKLKQPTVIAYLITGVLLGPYGLNIINDHESLSQMGELGVILLLFFAGMEVSPKKFAENWLVPTVGTLLQILITILITLICGYVIGWSAAKIFVFGSAICLSSTAVVLKLLEENDETKTRLGQNILGVLLIQDLAVVPMLIIIGLLGGGTPTPSEIFIQIIGGGAVIALAAWLASKDSIKIHVVATLGRDKEMRVFTAFIICFGMAMITGALGLSSALGAFVGGMIVATAKETEWVAYSLQPLKTVFLALFFVSVGMLIDLELIWEHLFGFFAILIIIYVINTLINALIFRSLKQSWCESLHGAALLSQLGEFGFVIITTAFGLGILSTQTYESSISIISLSLLFSPLWISIVRLFIKKCNLE